MRNQPPFHTIGFRWLLSGAILFTTASSATSRGTVEITTGLGAIRGITRVSRDGRLYYEFLGIPYAQPPVGELRFEPPVPIKSWGGGVLDATIPRASCPQYDMFLGRPLGHFDESCLFLNVATPQGTTTLSSIKGNQTKLFPVIVYFYGGSFMSGQADLYSPTYFMDQDIVFVTLNYRVGLFGFLNTGDGVVRGNMGLKDQVLALRWVQDNIRYFGGDPEVVTIMGQSAGGTSVHLHMLSPLSQGLFHRAISQSGCALSTLLVKKPGKQALRLGRYMNCPTSNTSAMVSCLKAIPAKTIHRANKEYTDFLKGTHGQYGPTVETILDEGAFLTDDPTKLLEAGNITRAPWIAGYLPNEGLNFAMLMILQNRRRPEVLESFQFDKYLATLFKYEDRPDAADISRAIRKNYLGEEKIGWDQLDMLSSMMTEGHFLSGIQDAIRLQSRLSPVYAYQLTYRGEFSIVDVIMGMAIVSSRVSGLIFSITKNMLVGSWSQWRKFIGLKQWGGGHADDIRLFFPLPFNPLNPSPDTPDYPMSVELVRVWAGFARDGTPGQVFGKAWEAVPRNFSRNPTEPVYMQLDMKSGMSKEMFGDRAKFWKSVLRT